MSTCQDECYTLALKVLAAKAKPPGSLGVLEVWAARLCELQQTLQPSVSKATLLLFAADHGITAVAPVSAYPREVTASVFAAVARRQAASAALCGAQGIMIDITDVGIDADVSSIASDSEAVAVHHAKVRPGSRSFLDGPCMAPEELEAAMREGARAVRRVVAAANASTSAGELAAAWAGKRPPVPQSTVATAGEAGAVAAAAQQHGQHGQHSGGGSTHKTQLPNHQQQHQESDGERVRGDGGGDGQAPAAAAAPGLVLAVGELGIGNTTAAAALLAALTGAAPQEVCGAGTGLTEEGIRAKQRTVAAALEANRELCQSGGVLGALQAVGGLELAAMAGAYLEAARLSIPTIVDGFVSGAAALAALQMDPQSVGRAFFLSHSSAERGTRVLVDALEAGVGHRPPLGMSMRLGEGTGAVLAVPLLRAAAALMCDMASLQEVLAAGASASSDGANGQP